MATIMAYTSSEGTRRCDATCHNAITPSSECECICGGRYHGKGTDAAMLQHTLEMAPVVAALTRDPAVVETALAAVAAVLNEEVA